MEATFYHIIYNGKLIEYRKTLQGVLRFVKRRGLKNGRGNCLTVVDNDGNEYNPTTGEPQETV